MKVLLCQKYEMYIENAPIGVESEELPMFQHLTEKRLPELALFTWCHEKAIQYVKSAHDVDSVVEYFGGIGRDSTIIQEELCPSSHTVIDINHAQCAHLKSLTRTYPDMVVLERDSFQCAGEYSADFVIWDAEFTLHQFMVNDELRDAMARAANGHEKCIMMSDKGPSRLNLNKNVYSRDSGIDIRDVDDYTYAVSLMLLRVLGHSITYVARYRKMSVYVLEPAPIDNPVVMVAEDYPESKAYFEVLEW